MDSQSFCFWLQGFFELSNPTTLNEAQLKTIQDHLKLVFTKVTPNYPINPPLVNPVINPIAPTIGMVPTAPNIPPYNNPINPWGIACDSGGAKMGQITYGNNPDLQVYC